MADNLRRLPNYTCLETIERSQRWRGRPLTLVDRIRLDVGVVDGKELFSWPGEDSFEDEAIQNIVPGGAINNGNFGTDAKRLFGSDAARFRWAGQQKLNGAAALRWDYVVDRRRGGYVVEAGDQKAVVGTHGSVWVNPGTLDVLRLEVLADDIPVSTKVRRVSSVIDYSRAKIGESEFLLPRDSRLRVLRADLTESVNIVRFSDCHEYAGASRLVEDESAAAVPAVTAPATISLPGGAVLAMELETPIRAQTSAIGDRLIFGLKNAVKVGGTVVFDKGAVVRGRLTLLRRSARGEGYLVGVKLLDVESGLKRATVNAALRLSSFHDTDGDRRLVRASNARGDLGSVFFQIGDDFQMKRGETLFWHTVAAGRPASRE